MSANALLKKMPQALNADAAAGVNCVINFNCSQPVNITIKDGAATAADGSSSSADLTVTMEDDDMIALLKGELNGMTAFMTGKLQIEGDMMLAQQIGSLFDASKVG